MWVSMRLTRRSPTGIWWIPRKCASLAGCALAVLFVSPAWAQEPSTTARRCPAPASASLDEPARRPTAPPTTPAVDQQPGAPTAAAAAPGNSRIDVDSDNATLSAEGDAKLSGNVKVRQGDREIDADEVEYDSRSDSFKVRGRVEYRDPVLRARGGSGEYSQSTGASFEGAEFELPARPARGSARNMTLDINGRVRLEQVTFSTCPADDPAWRIRANTIELDTKSGTGTGRAAAVEFKGVPIIYLPYLSFPLGNQRKSGFLFPSLGHTTRSGAQAAVPYYWNIAPNLDATLQPTVYAKRGIDLGGDFRYLMSTQKGSLSANFLPGDSVDNNDRSRVHWLHSADLAGDWQLSIDAQGVSDSGYFEDFSQGPEGTSTAFLKRVARLRYRDEFWNLRGEFQNVQTVDRDLPLADRPYATLPRLLASAAASFGPRGIMRYSLDSELVNFDRSTGTTGWRFDAEPTFALDIAAPGYYVRPAAGLRYTRYALHGAAPGADDSPQRSLPFASVDAGLVLERYAGSRNQRRITLEPRALYLYTPFREQSSLPVFDTGVPDLNFVQLFRNNRYVGADRISDANQLSVGVSGGLFDSTAGSRFLTASVGQTYYLETPRVVLPGEAARRSNTSDLVAQVSLTAYKDWTLDLGTQWNPDNSARERSQFRLQYRPGAERVINLGYRSQRNRLEQGELSGAWPVGQKWNLFARWVYDLQGNESLERFAGLEYKACCWRLRTVARRFVSGRTGERDTGIYLQLELNGLASVGSAADSFLEQAVRGYSGSYISP